MKSEKHEVLMNQPAEAVWRAHIKNFQVTLPSIVPQHYSSVEYLDGPPLATGGIVRLNYNSASFPHFDYIKFKWGALDHEKYFCKCEILEGGHLQGKPDTVKMIYTVKLEPGPRPNTCVKVWTFYYDEGAPDNIIRYLKEEMSVFGDALESHLSSKAA